MSKLSICLLGSFMILLMFIIVIIISFILDYYEEHPFMKRRTRVLMKIFIKRVINYIKFLTPWIKHWYNDFKLVKSKLDLEKAKLDLEKTENKYNKN